MVCSWSAAELGMGFSGSESEGEWGSSGSGCECTVYAESALPLSAPPFQTSAPSAQTGVTHRAQPR